jgi:hypothetical protein
VSSHKAQSAEFQVHYLGSSADLAALRRSLEARGAVSRSRLTPGVLAVVADATVPLDHPTLVAARELGIDIYQPAEAIDRLLSTPASRQRAMPPPIASTPLITVMVLALIGVLAVLGTIGVLASANDPPQVTTVQQVVDDR